MANTWPDLVARAHQYQELEHYLMEKSIGMLMQEVTRKKYAQDFAAIAWPLGLGLISDSNIWIFVSLVSNISNGFGTQGGKLHSSE